MIAVKSSYVMKEGLNMIWAQLRIILAVRVRVTLRRAQNIFMLKNINSFTIKKNKPKKKW